MTNKTAAAQAALAKQPSFDIKNEAWREYIYPNGNVLRVVGAVTMILDKRPDGDRHHETADLLWSQYRAEL